MPKRFMETDPTTAFCYGWGAACAQAAELLKEKGLDKLAEQVFDLAANPKLDNFMEEYEPPAPKHTLADMGFRRRKRR
jgi:hypothetical protein